MRQSFDDQENETFVFTSAQLSDVPREPKSIQEELRLLIECEGKKTKHSSKIFENLKKLAKKEESYLVLSNLKQFLQSNLTKQYYENIKHYNELIVSIQKQLRIVHEKNNESYQKLLTEYPTLVLDKDLKGNLLKMNPSYELQNPQRIEEELHLLIHCALNKDQKIEVFCQRLDQLVENEKNEKKLSSLKAFFEKIFMKKFILDTEHIKKLLSSIEKRLKCLTSNKKSLQKNAITKNINQERKKHTQKTNIIDLYNNNDK